MPHQDQKYIDGLSYEDQVIIEEIYVKYLPQCKEYILKNGGNIEDAEVIFQYTLIQICESARKKDIVLMESFSNFIKPLYINVYSTYKVIKMPEAIDVVEAELPPPSVNLEPLLWNLPLPIQKQKKSKEDLLNKLAGSWKDINDNIIEDIYKNRTTSDKEIDLDQ